MDRKVKLRKFVSARGARYGTVAGLVAAAAVIAVIVGVLAITRDSNDSTAPVGATPTEPTEAIGAIGATRNDALLRNGRITTVERYLGADPGSFRDFDPASGTGLFLTRDGLAVVGRAGRVATLPCDSDVPCSPTTSSVPTVATLGPGADEVTVGSGDPAAEIIGYDGSLRRRIDLAATVTGGEDVRGLRWSPDGSRLAVLVEGHNDLTGLRGCHVRSCGGTGSTSRVWLLDRETGKAQLVYSLLDVKESADTFGAARRLALLLPSEFDGCCRIWFPGQGWSWSPDGHALLLDVLMGQGRHSPRVVVLHLPPGGAAGQVRDQVFDVFRGWDNQGTLAWSPDGTRIAVKTYGGDGHDGHGTIEISAEDGSILAEHPHNSGWLIWPAKPG